jgi:hypothetical protein
MKVFKLITFVMAIMLAFGATDSIAQTKKKSTTVRKKPVLKTAPKTTATVPTVKMYTVEKAQTIRVRMNGTISSKTAKVGDTFTTTVTEPVYSTTGVIVVPVGAAVNGKITAVTPAAKGGKPGTIDVDFVSIRTPTGATYAISGDLTELDSKSAKSDNEGTASGDKMKHRKIIFIGGGVGAAIGAGAGAVAGMIFESQTKGEEATVKANSEFGIYLNKSVLMPKFVEPID